MRAAFHASLDEFVRIIADPIFVKSAMVLIGIDLLFVLIHIGDRSLFHLTGTGIMSLGSRFSIETDGGIPEIYSYIKTLVAIAGLHYVFRRSGNLIYLSLSVVFILVLVDDGLQLHERGGWLLQDLTTPGRATQDLGELITWGILGCVAGPLLLAGYLKADAPSRRIGLIFMVLIGVLMTFAIGIDMLHSQLDTPFPGAWFIMMLAEDAGELVTISLICASSLVLANRYRHADAPQASHPVPGALRR